MTNDSIEILKLLNHIIQMHIYDYDKTLYGDMWFDYSNKVVIKLRLKDNEKYTAITLYKALTIIKQNIDNYLAKKKLDTYLITNIEKECYKLSIELIKFNDIEEYNIFKIWLKMIGLWS